LASLSSRQPDIAILHGRLIDALAVAQQVIAPTGISRLDVCAHLVQPLWQIVQKFEFSSLQDTAIVECFSFSRALVERLRTLTKKNGVHS